MWQGSPGTASIHSRLLETTEAQNETWPVAGSIPSLSKAPLRLNDSLSSVFNNKVKDNSRTFMNLVNLLSLSLWGDSWLAKEKTRRGMQRREKEGRAKDRKEASRVCLDCGAWTPQCLYLWLSDLLACQNPRGQCGRRSEQGGSCHQPTGWISRPEGAASSSGVRVWF